MNSVMSDLPNTASVPDDESWVHEAEFKNKLDSAEKWMHHYIANYPDRDGSNWVILPNVFQCEVHELSALEMENVVETLKRIWSMSWDGILKDGNLDCKELASDPGKYALRLSDSHRAIAGRDGRRMLFLTLHEDSLPNALPKP